MCKRITQRNNGFTLVELLVAVALFSIVVTITMGSIFTIVDTNRKSQTLTLVMNNLNFALESMTRTIKTATVIQEDGGEYQFKEQDDDPDDLVDDGKYVMYAFFPADSTIKKCIKDFPSICSDGEYEEFLASEVKIKNFTLEELDGGPNDQPRFLLTTSGYAEITSRVRSDFSIQTTVTPRVLQLDS